MHRLVGRVAELGDDGGRRFRRCSERVPGVGFAARHAGLRQTGNVRERGDALFGGDRKNSCFARLVQLKRGRELVEHHIDMTGDQVVERRRRALIGHMDELGVRDRLEQLSGQVRRGADALRGVVEPARIGLGVGDQLLHRLGGEIGSHHQDVRNMRHDGDRYELRWVVIE